MSLSKKAFSSFNYVFASSILSKLIVLIGGIIMARILSPEDFGLIAMLYIIFETSNFIISAGFGIVLIREKEVTEADLSTVFWFNLITSFSLVSLIWIFAQDIADFYNEPRLVVVSKIMSLNLIFSSFGMVQSSMYQKELRFKELGIRKVISSLFTILVGVYLAMTGWGYLALAVKYTIGSLISAILLYSMRPWRPTSFIESSNFKRMFKYGGNVMVLGIINTLTRNAHQIVIGKYFSSKSLGFFNQGNMLKDNLVNTLTDAVYQVSFPLLAKIQEDKERMKAGYIRILGLTSFVIFPLIIIFLFIAKPLIIVLLGTKWVETTPYFQLLLISGGLNHIHSMNINILKVYGKGRDYLNQGIFRNVITIIGIIIGVRFGTLGIAVSLVVADFIQLGINTYYSNKYIKFNIIEQIRTIGPILLLNFSLLILSFACNSIIDSNTIVYLFIFPVVFLISYSFIARLLHFKEYAIFLGLISRKKA
jgi:O-antigen/teichoic acid export membrane protein